MNEIITAKPYPDVTIEFAPGRHKYAVTWDGHFEKEPVISATTVTGVVDKSGPLVGWAVKLTGNFLVAAIERGDPITIELIEEAKRQHRIKKQEAADKGTLVHDWIEAFVKGEKPLVPTDPQVRQGVKAFLKWVNETDVEFLESEQIIYSKKFHYAGKTDAKVRINGKLAVLDYKTSSGLYNEFRYQTASYQQALAEMTGEQFGNRWLLRLDKETGEFEPHEIPDFQRDLDAFLGALAVKRREVELENAKKNVAKQLSIAA